MNKNNFFGKWGSKIPSNSESNEIEGRLLIKEWRKDWGRNGTVQRKPAAESALPEKYHVKSFVNKIGS